MLIIVFPRVVCSIKKLANECSQFLLIELVPDSRAPIKGTIGLRIRIEPHKYSTNDKKSFSQITLETRMSVN